MNETSGSEHAKASASGESTYIGEVDSPTFIHSSPEELAHAAEIAAHDHPLEHTAADQAAEVVIAVAAEQAIVATWTGGTALAAGGSAIHAIADEVSASHLIAGEGAAAAEEIIEHQVQSHGDAETKPSDEATPQGHGQAAGTYLGEVDSPDFVGGGPAAPQGQGPELVQPEGTYLGEVDSPDFVGGDSAVDTKLPTADGEGPPGGLEQFAEPGE